VKGFKMASAFAARSIWADTASRFSLSVPFLSSERNDLTIVGGGILGLSSALHAARRGLSVRVLEAGEIGSGASGLNGGQVIPGLKYDPSWLIKHFGEHRGEALVRFTSTTADHVFNIIENEGLDVPHCRNGWIEAAHTPKAARAAEQLAREWADRGVAARALSEGEIARLTGAKGYFGGWLDPRAGTIHPLAYTRELARAAASKGAKIVANTRATRIRKADSLWEIQTSSGASIHSKAIIVATNAYADDLIPGLRKTLLPLHSFQIATAPLSSSDHERILPGGQAVADSRRIVVYYRKSPDGRLLMGGRGRMTEPTSASDWAHLEHAMIRLFPFLRGIEIQRRWFGRVAMTLDFLPHLHEPEKGLLIAAGCQGSGIGLMTALAPHLVDYAFDRNPEALPLPLTPIKPIPLHRFHRIGVGAAIGWYRMLDALDK
jgi:glycine/D-amino acid oxidase-like deaminating enzyme